MQVAVTSVKNVADGEAVFLADFVDVTKGLREFRTRDDAVEDVVAGSETAERAEGVFAALPKELAFLVIASDANFAGAVQIANIGYGGGLRGDGFGEALDFQKKDGGAIAREPGVNVVLDGGERPAV